MQPALGTMFTVVAAAPYGEVTEYGYFTNESAARDCVQVLYSEAVIRSLIGGDIVVTRMQQDGIGRPQFETFEIDNHDEATELCDDSNEGESIHSVTYGIARLDTVTTVGQWIDNRPTWMGLHGC